ncbi:PTS mannose/fructose/sorbose/N-acetylgalactosamine transporter subunit IIC [Streptomyces sp. enrichment culture]|uniref:PTS mannose/fructose/sorbose/N-acetylgalactosamine transporter subunit IIC n=1 Tax=Streptomyces sp. enrichment culture TaxID=1795815 RepID=UPI003F565AD6
MSLTQAILIGLVAALTWLDGAWLGEMKFREPIITGFLVGLVLGDVTQGLVIGATLQLMWMGVTGVGAAPKIDIGVGGTIGAAAALTTGGSAADATLFAVPVAVLMQLIHTLMMSGLSAFMPWAERRIAHNDIKGAVGIHYLAGLIGVLVYAIPSAVGMYYGTGGIKTVVNGIPDWVQNGLTGVAALLPALGFAMLLDVIMTKKLIPFLILGFVPAAFVGHDLTMVGIAAIAVALAMVMYSLYTDLQNRHASTTAAGAPVPATVSSPATGPDDEWED